MPKSRPSTKKQRRPGTIALLVTGGTFDKEYNELDGTLYFKDSHVPEMLAPGRSRVPVVVRTLMMVDSLCLD